MHSIGLHESETTHADFKLAELYEAQRKSWNALKAIQAQIKPGMNEMMATQLATQILNELGSTKFWHRSIIRFGSNTLKDFSARIDESKVLQENDLMLIDLGPVWSGDDGLLYEGDVGETFVIGKNERFEACAKAARELHHESCEYWRDLDKSSEAATGEHLYEWLIERAKERGYALVPEVRGHRVGDFPHKKKGISSGKLSEVKFVPSPGIWVLEVQLQDPSNEFGAFYEDFLR